MADVVVVVIAGGSGGCGGLVQCGLQIVVNFSLV